MANPRFKERNGFLALERTAEVKKTLQSFLVLGNQLDDFLFASKEPKETP
jgi:hypothetical protein